MDVIQDACAIGLIEVVAQQRPPGWVEADGLAIAVEDRQEVQIGVEKRIKLA
jgi:hypothetical protein